MKNNTIYLAKITKLKDYGSDLILDLEAFDTLEKAEAFMMENDMVRTGWGGWEMPDAFDYEGTIDALEIK
jgi:hypothetical protein